MPKVAFQMPGAIDLGLMIFSRLLLVLSLVLLPLTLWQGWQWQAERRASADSAPIAEKENLLLSGESRAAGAPRTGPQAGRGLARPDPRDPFVAVMSEWLRREADGLLLRIGREAHASAGSASGGDLRLALAAALERAFPDLDRRAYYMLWQGTAIVCSPLNPELHGFDLGYLADAHGVRFISELAALAGRGGGVASFHLDGSGAGPGSGHGSGPGYGPGPGGISGTFLAYAAPFEDSGIHLTIWRNTADSVGGAFYGFVPPSAEQARDRPLPSRGRLLAGLLLLQFSCLGLGLVLRYGRW